MGYKISTFIISLLVVSFIVGTLGLLLAEGSQNYNKNTDSLQGNLSKYNKLEEIANKSEEIQNKTLGIKTKSGALDVIGDYFTSAYDAVVISKDSFTTFNEMSNDVMESSWLGASGKLLWALITTTVLIVIFVGILLSTILKRDM